MKSFCLLFVFVAVATACSDKFPAYCGDWKKTGFCDKDEFKDYMKQNCEVTCGICTPSGTLPSLPPLNCFDRNSYCSSYKAYCTDPGYVDYLQRECKYTCNYCHITTTPPPTTTTPKPYTGAAGKNLQSNCGHKGPSHTRIVGGTNSKPGDWPWQVSIEYEKNPNNPGNWCGGTMINDEWVLSAVHCFENDPVKERYHIKLGEHDLKTSSSWEQKFDVAEMVLHPKYVKSNNDYDLALLRLHTKANFTDRVRPACIPEHQTNFTIGTDCYITGWGLLKSFGDGPAILQQAKVPLIDQKVCQKSFYDYGGNQKLTPRMLCAGYSSVKIDSCQGDSGGPLVCKKRDAQTNEDVWYLWGSISWGIGCAQNGLYGVYSNTKSMSDWITSIAFKN